jgi:hypothetical protein
MQADRGNGVRTITPVLDGFTDESFLFFLKVDAHVAVGADEGAKSPTTR